MRELTQEQVGELIDRVCAQLMEHGDAVQIMFSRLRRDGSTEWVRIGRGNWYARMGMAKEFVERGLAINQAEELAKRLHDDP